MPSADLPSGLRISHPPSEGGQIVILPCLDLYHTPPDSGKHQCKSRARKRRFDATLKTGGGFRVSGFGCVVHGFRLQVSSFVLRKAFWLSNFVLRVAFRASDFEFCACSGFWAPHKFRISGFGQVPNFGFLASSGFWVSGDL